MWVCWESELGLSPLIAPESLCTGFNLVAGSADTSRVLGLVRPALSLGNDVIDLGSALSTLVTPEPVASQDSSALGRVEVIPVLALLTVPVRGRHLVSN